jgi:predicted amidohydrolase YtcJ
LSADLVLLNAIVRTMNSFQPVAQSVAIKKNKIILVGTNEIVSQLIDNSTKVIDLTGKTVIPGLIDTHIHVADFGRCLLWLDLTKVESIRQLQSCIREKVTQIPAGKWIIGRGWNQNRFEEKRLLNVSDLNYAAIDNPVILYHESEMICAVNDKALNLGYITKQTAVPSGGNIDKTPQTGELTGILRGTATSLVWRVVPEPTASELSEATILACQEIVRAGLTSVHWIILSENEIELIQRLHMQDKLPVRVNIIVPEAFMKQTIEIKSTDNLMLRVGGIMIAIDGYLDSKTAALLESYSDEPINSGTLLLTEETLASSVADVLAAGFQPIIHAMGDKAVDRVLRLIEYTFKLENIRFRIEQAAILNEDLVERLKKCNVVVTIQPKVISTEFAVWSAIKHLGEERARWLHPLKTLIKEGIKVAGGSDCPMEPLDPFLGMHEAVLRPSFPEQRLTAYEALGMYTVDAAYSCGEEQFKGSIQEGKLADLTVLSKDPLAVLGTDFTNITVEMTIIDGKVIYSKVN